MPVKNLKKFYNLVANDSFEKALRVTGRYMRRKLYLEPILRIKKSVRTSVFLNTYILMPGYSKIDIEKTDGTYVVTNKDKNEVIAFPQKPTIQQLSHMSEGYKNNQERKYSSKTVFVEKDDIVIDVGAFVGAFSLYACEKASRVISIEPERKNYKCLKKNTITKANIETVNAAVHNSKTEASINISQDPTDHSLIGVDKKPTGKSETVKAIRLDKILEVRSLEKVNFVKIDAEGLEPEVLKSIGTADVEKMAIDCNPEREGESTSEEVKNILERKGYVCYGDRVIFAKKK